MPRSCEDSATKAELRALPRHWKAFLPRCEAPSRPGSSLLNSRGCRKNTSPFRRVGRTWGRGPFITLDAVVLCAGHVLPVRRGRHPGKGLWAIPGGFLELTERLLDGALRELQEETGLVLKTHLRPYELRKVAVFDHPDRSQRGRTITHCPLLSAKRICASGSSGGRRRSRSEVDSCLRHFGHGGSVLRRPLSHPEFLY